MRNKKASRPGLRHGRETIVPLLRLALGIFPFVCTGCATVETKMQGVVDPDFRDRTYSRVLIAPMFEDLAIRAATETSFAEALQATQTEGVASLDILLPTREWTQEQIIERAAAEKCDGVLVIEQTDAFQERQYVPETTTVDRSYYWSGYPTRRYGRWGYGRVNSTAVVRRSGGYFVDLPRVRHELRLYDVASKRVAWLATSLTSGDSSMTDEKLLSSLAGEAVNCLIVDGVTQAKPKPEPEKKQSRKDNE